MPKSAKKDLARRISLLRAIQQRKARIRSQEERAKRLMRLANGRWKKRFLNKLVGWPTSEKKVLYDELMMETVLEEGSCWFYVFPEEYRRLGFHRSPDSCREWRCYEDIVRDMESVADYWREWVTIEVGPLPVGSIGHKKDYAKVTITLIGFTLEPVTE